MVRHGFSIGIKYDPMRDKGKYNTPKEYLAQDSGYNMRVVLGRVLDKFRRTEGKGLRLKRLDITIQDLGPLPGGEANEAIWNSI